MINFAWRNQNISNALIMKNLAILFLGLAVVFTKAQYNLLGSNSCTAAILCAVLVLSKVIYRLALYPQFFTPLKHIQTPSVRLEPLDAI